MNKINKSLSQKKFLQTVGDGSVLWIDPSKIMMHHGTDYPSTKAIKTLIQDKVPFKRARQILHSRISEPFIISRTKFHDGVPMESLFKYKKVKDLIENMTTLENSIWHQKLMKQISTKGLARHKKEFMSNEKDVTEFLMRYIEKVVKSIERDGFSDSFTGYEATAMIDSSGQIGKTSHGNHRFFIARALQIDRFPLKIVGVHEDWYRRLKAKEGKITYDCILNALQDVQSRHR